MSTNKTDSETEMEVVTGTQPRVVYTEEGEMLTEVVVPDDPPPDDDDDNESVWTAASENDDELDVDRVTSIAEDMSLFALRKHTDSVYCAALHPSRKGVVVTGNDLLFDDRHILIESQCSFSPLLYRRIY